MTDDSAAPVAYPDPAVADSVASVAESAAGPVADSVVDSAATSAAEAVGDPPAERDPLDRRTDSLWSWIRPNDWKQPNRTPWVRS